MLYIDAMKKRHSVRSYKDDPIEEVKVQALRRSLEKYNAESGLDIRLFTEEPGAFGADLWFSSNLKNVRNYFAIIGDAHGKDVEEKCGYYGEKAVLDAQILGLNTCWVALTYNKSKVPAELPAGKKLHIVIALGYGETGGVPHKSKPLEKLSDLSDSSPEWYRKGVEMASLAPTAINQQKFYFERTGNVVTAKALMGFYNSIDLGIAKLHFELGAGKENFIWG